MLWARYIPVDSEECKWIDERIDFWMAEKDIKTWFIIAVI